MLAGETKDDPAGNQQGQARRAREQLDEDRCGGAQMLGVVEHEQHLACAKRGRDRLEWIAGHVLEVERPRDRGDDERGVAERCEVDEDGAVGVRVCELAGELESEAGLAGAAGAAEGEQADLVAQQQLAQLIELAFAAERSVGWRRSVGAGGWTVVGAASVGSCCRILRCSSRSPRPGSSPSWSRRRPWSVA